MLVRVRDPQANEDRGHFERIVVPERQQPLIAFGVDTGVSMTIPAVTARLDVEVEIVDGESRFDPRELAQAYGRDIPGVTVAAADVGIATFNPDEADLASVMRAQGATNAQIQTSLDSLRANRRILPASDSRAEHPFTRPSLPRGEGVLTGAPEETRHIAHRRQRSGLERQNESARILAAEGFRVHQNPNVSPEEMLAAGLSPTRRPDFIIEGRVFDSIAPITDSVGNLHRRIADKIARGQAHRVVVNLGGSNISRAQIEQELGTHPIPGLQEVITIDQQGRLGHAYP